MAITGAAGAAGPVIATVRPPPSRRRRVPAVTPGMTAQMMSQGVQRQRAMRKPMTAQLTPVRPIRLNPSTLPVRTNVPPPPPPSAPQVEARPTRDRRPIPRPTLKTRAASPPTAADRMPAAPPVGRATRTATDPAAAEPVRPQANRAVAAVRPPDPHAAGDLRDVPRAALRAHPAAATAGVPAAVTAVQPTDHRVSGLRPPVHPAAAIGWASESAFPLLPGIPPGHRERREWQARGFKPRLPYSPSPGRPHWLLNAPRRPQQPLLRQQSPAPVERSARRPY
jgi:hypothetical protein